MADKAKAQSEIDFLTELERGDVITQMSLARRVSVSVGFVNALLKRAVKKGYVKVQAAPYKRYVYYLTPKGFQEKSRLVAEYLETSLDFYRQARGEYAELFTRAKSCGQNSFVLAGDGELVEIALLAASEAGVDVLGVYSPGSNLAQKHGQSILTSFDDIPAADQIVLVESRTPQDVYDEIAGKIDAQKVLTPAFLRITREPLGFGSAKAGRGGQTK